MKPDKSFVKITNIGAETPPAAYSGALATEHTINIATNQDLSGVAGQELYLGYGIGSNDTDAKVDSQNNSRYQRLLFIGEK